MLLLVDGFPPSHHRLSDAGAPPILCSQERAVWAKKGEMRVYGLLRCSSWELSGMERAPPCIVSSRCDFLL